MKIALIGSFPTITPLYNSLIEKEELVAVFFQNENYSTQEVNTINNLILTQTRNYFVSKHRFNVFLEEFLNNEEIDLVLISGCSVKISKKVFSIPRYGILNIHYGKFPENRGADPLFWSLKNNDKNTTITIHKINEVFDRGDILYELVVLDLQQKSGQKDKSYAATL